MAGMTGMDCHSVRVELTEFLLLGRPLPARLSRHVGTCAACAREVAEIGDVARTLRLAEPASFGSNETVSAQQETVPGRDLGVRIAREIRAARVARRHRIALAAAAVAAVLVGGAGLIPVLSHDHPASNNGQPAAHAVALARAGEMIPRPWGTEVPVALSGLQPGQVYRLMAVNAVGQQTPGGSVRTISGEPVRTSIMTAMSRDSIVALLMEDQQGQRVAEIAVSPPSRGASATPTS